MTAAALVDTNVLVYRYDPRDARKQRIAADVLRRGIADGSLIVPHQVVIEFYAAVTRPLRGAGRLLEPVDALRETEEILTQFDVLYPGDELVRAALRATAAYQLSWFDALIWAYAETNGVYEIISEDFQHGRSYGRVKVTNPFR
ncbi:MAG TPA: PIN domain-containing protein [Thermoanaerobaculia bacterium]|nr:PIN domain-containing protein [Thermoanaerobaculia bacterium]